MTAHEIWFCFFSKSHGPGNPREPPKKHQKNEHPTTPQKRNETMFQGPSDGSGTAFVCIVNVPKFLTLKKIGVPVPERVWDVLSGGIWDTFFSNLANAFSFQGKGGWLFNTVWNEFIVGRNYHQAIDWCNAQTKTSANQSHIVQEPTPSNFTKLNLSDLPQSKNLVPPPVSREKITSGGCTKYRGIPQTIE